MGPAAAREPRPVARTLAPGLLALAIAASTAMAACQSTLPSQAPDESSPVSAAPGSEAPRPSAALSGPAVDATRAAIDSADITKQESIETLSTARFTHEGAAAAALAIQSGATGDALWAATWIYGASGDDPAILLPLLSSSDRTIQAMAAASLLAWGRKEAAHVLVTLLSADGIVRGSEPPVSIAALADSTLDRFVDGPALASDATPEDRAAAWSSWFTANEASMQFDIDTATWHAP